MLKSVENKTLKTSDHIIKYSMKNGCSFSNLLKIIFNGAFSSSLANINIAVLLLKVPMLHCHILTWIITVLCKLH